MLTNTKVVFLHFLLRPLDALGDHRTLNSFTVFKAESIHHTGYSLGCKQTHQLVFQRDIEYGRAWIALASGTTTKLTIYTTALVSFCADDGQTAGCFDFGRELDVSTTSGHIRCNSYGSQHTFFLVCVSVLIGNRAFAECTASGLCHDISFLLMAFRIEHIMGDIT